MCLAECQKLAWPFAVLTALCLAVLQLPSCLVLLEFFVGRDTVDKDLGQWKSNGETNHR